MRRALSILMLVLLGLPTWAALLPGGEELRLPACCRRNGLHHCAMAAQAIAADSGEPGAFLTGPTHCPAFPRGASIRTIVAQLHLQAAAGSYGEVRLAPIDSHPKGADRPCHYTGRGPPQFTCAI